MSNESLPKNEKIYWITIIVLVTLIFANHYHTLFTTNTNPQGSQNDVEYFTEPYAIDEEAQFEDLIEEYVEEQSKDTVQVKEIKEKKVKESKNNKYSMSETGKNFIKEKEALRLSAYRIKGEKLLTIGYGHQIQKNESYKEIDEKTAEEIFENDINKINASINRILKNINPKFKFSQGFIDGLGSLIYNCGESGVKNTEFYKRLKNCRFDKSTSSKINTSDLTFTLAAVKTTHVYLKGHKTRRIQEHNMMKS